MAHSHTETNGDDGTSTLMENTRYCCCFPAHFFGSQRSSSVRLAWWERVRSSQVSDDKWWSGGLRSLKKLREWSELVAGPKWKTFIRRFNRNRSGGGGGGNSGSSCNRHGKFQYDPLSYALNFDEGPGQNGNLEGEDDYTMFRNFSTRYASVPVPGQLPLKPSNSTSSSSSSSSSSKLLSPPLDSGKHVAVFA
jgi:hypothetical protein|uniref:NHL repeat-containing protein n=1 Tax=Fagus sylvatica TaxID=28930 RepID=A0A2N9I876_FAGSY